MMLQGFGMRANHAMRHVLVAWLGAGALAVAYGVAAVWHATGVSPTAALWGVILPLAGVIALLAAALVAVWHAAPALAAWRSMRNLMSEAARTQPQSLFDALFEQSFQSDFDSGTSHVAREIFDGRPVVDADESPPSR